MKTRGRSLSRKRHEGDGAAETGGRHVSDRRADRVDVPALLASVDLVELIGRHVPLKKSGAEFEACCPFHAEETPSFKVSPAKQFYHCFGCGAHGDALRFLQDHLGMTFVQAVEELGGKAPGKSSVKSSGKARGKAPGNGPRPAERVDEKAQAPAPPAPAKPRSLWVPQMPVPEGAGEPPKAHPARGIPQAQWCYRNAAGEVLGYICRFTTSSGGKEVLPLTWCRHEATGKTGWRWIAFPVPRPLYGLDRLAARPEATVMVVEGEKCADVGAIELPDLVVVTWSGGCGAVDKSDWLPLTGRKVLLFPDCDAHTNRHTGQLLPEAKQPGFAAMRKICALARAMGCKVWQVRIPAPGEVAAGWDIADAVAEGLTGDALAAWVRERARLLSDEPASGGAPEHAPDDAPPDGCDANASAAWRQTLLYTKHGELAACLSNVHDILLNSRQWSGVLGFDEFAARTMKLRPPPYFGGETGEWGAADDSRCAMWLTRNFRFAPATALVAEAIETLALVNSYHPVRQWLRALPRWDGIERTECWLTDFVEAKDSEYIRRVAKWFLIGMVARVMRPGVKFDYCLVLEGTQGRGKSSVAAVLGGAWFGDTDLDLQHKDSMAALLGKWVYEFPEMGSVTRVESSRQKSFLSRQYDDFRPVYGRRQIRLRRQCVFVGTTNEWEWNKDPTGGRRFWPVEVGEIHLDGLRAMREQLFAEALWRFEQGERFWPDQHEQRALFDPEQLAREQPDSLIDALHDWAFSQVSDFSIADAVMDGLKLDASKLTRDLQTRVGIALRKLGCEKVERRNGMIRYWYKPPVRNEAKSTSAFNGPAQHASEGGTNAPF